MPNIFRILTNHNNMKNKKDNIKKEVKAVIDAYRSVGKHTDPNGSYTGDPRDKDKQPVQDVDDL